MTNKQAGCSRLIHKNDLMVNAIDKCLALFEGNNEMQTLHSTLYEQLQAELDEDYLTLNFVKSIKTFWNANSKEKKMFISDLLIDNQLYLPEYEKPARNAELEERIQSIKAQLDEDAYQKMVLNVNMNSHLRADAPTNKSGGGIFPEFKTAQGQLVSIFNIAAVVGGAFVFGYKAVEYSLDTPDITKQMFGGFMLALIVAIADLYFLFKRLMQLDAPVVQSSNEAKRTSGRSAATPVIATSAKTSKGNTKSSKQKKND